MALLQIAMITKLEFHPEEHQELYLALNAWRLLSCLREVDMELRGHLKHGSERTADELAEHLREMIWEDLRDFD